MKRIAVLLMLLTGLGACTDGRDLSKPPTYLGNFHLGHNVVVAPNIVKGPASRDATKEEWIEAMRDAMEVRFTRYEGTRFYNIGVSVEGYVLAVAGIPVVAAPRSALIVRVTAWDDEKAKKLNAEPKVITAFETFSGETVVSSGLTQSREVQMANLTANAAKLIELWLAEQNQDLGWFEDDGRPAKEKAAPLIAPQTLDADAEETTSGDTIGES